jgi:hypothetical protein
MIVTALLAGCGGNDPSSTSPTVTAQSKQFQRSDKAAASAADYASAVQELYISYYGRPADPAGLAYWGGVLLADNAPTSLQNLNAVYSSNAAVKAVVDSFGNSAESVALYGTGNPTAFVTAIYQNALGRAPDTAGLAYWAGLVSNGTITQGQAALAIIAAAASEPTTSSDEQLVNNRLTVANYFDAQITSQNALSAYSGLAANAVVRNMLSNVTATTNTTSYEATVNATIPMLGVGATAMAFTKVQAIITQRCVPCHSIHPVEPGFSPAPLGVMLDTPAEINQYAALIYQYAVQQQIMPYGNITGMTSSERSTIGAWYLAGAMQ